MLKDGYTYLFFDATSIYPKENKDPLELVDKAVERFKERFKEEPTHLIVPNKMGEIIDKLLKMYSMEVSVLPESFHKGMLYVGKELETLI